MDDCPPEVTVPAIRAIWHELDTRAREALLAGLFQAPSGARQLSGPGQQRGNYSAGNPETNSHDQRIAGTRRRRPGTPEATSSDTTLNTRERRRRRIDEGSPARDPPVPVDPVLLREDFERIAVQNLQTLSGRVTMLETAHREGLVATAVPLVPPGAGLRGRGGSTRARGGRSRQRARAVPVGSASESEDDQEEEAVFSTTEEAAAAKDQSDALSIIKTRNKNLLSPEQRTALKTSQAAVVAAFRESTGVLTTKESWPKWISSTAEWTGPGLPVNFEGTVTHPVNRKLFQHVAKVAMQDLKKHVSTHATWIDAPDVKLTHVLLVELAKGSFRGFKHRYDAQEDAVKKQRLQANERASRWCSRRRKKCQNLLAAVEEYQKTHDNRDPTLLLVPDLMSDEASGPEDTSGEDLIAWKRRMYIKDGRTEHVPEEVVKKKTFFEVIQPKWRSQELTTIYHDLWAIWYSSVSVRFANAMTTRISNTNRATLEPPPYTPYNFGIDQQWYMTHKDEPAYSIKLRTWMNYPGPPGFGEDAEDAEGIGGAPL